MDALGVHSNQRRGLDLELAAMVEVTSEKKQYPVESALVSGEIQGWLPAILATSLDFTAADVTRKALPAWSFAIPT